MRSRGEGQDQPTVSAETRRTTTRTSRPFLKQQSYSLDDTEPEVGVRSPATPDACSLIHICEAWASEAFRLPCDFLRELQHPGVENGTNKNTRSARRSRTRNNDAEQADEEVPFLDAMPKGPQRQITWSSAKPRPLEFPQRSSLRPNGHKRSNGDESGSWGRAKHNRGNNKNSANSGGSSEDDADVFDFLTQLFGFQRDSVRNQRENGITLLASRLARSIDKEGDSEEDLFTPDKVADVVVQWRKEQLANYKKWCRHVWSWQIKLKKVLPEDVRLACAFEIALNLLLWGEAANLRFCPEFLCWAYHKCAKRLRDVIKSKTPVQVLRSYLQEVIRPCYLTLSEQYEDRRSGAKPYLIKNYDDFNETFWQRSCLGLDVVDLTQGALRRKFTKTFVERQSWLLPLASFWRVQMMLFFGLHMLIVAAVCNTEGGCPGDDSLSYWYTPALTLAVCYLLVDAYEIFFVTWRKIVVQCHLFTVLATLGRAFIKLVILAWLYGSYPSGVFVNSARLYYTLVGLLELLKFTPLIGTLQGRAGPWWVVINILLGLGAAATYARIDRQPGKRKVLLYSIFWILILSAKFLFNFFFMIRPLVASTRAVWNLDVGGMYDLGFVTFSDRHNVGVLVGIWISVGFIYFIDLQVWFIVAESIASACYGVAMHVGEKLSPQEVCGSFEGMYRIFFKYLELGDRQRHFRFAYVWNEVVDAMRKEDIICDAEMAGLKYFVVSLHRQSTATKPSVLALLPGFLVSGKIQSSMKLAYEFTRQNDDLIKNLVAVDAWGKGEDGAGERYANVDRRRVSSTFLGIIENFTATDVDAQGGWGRGGGGDTTAKLLRSLQKEQRRFLRGILSVSDPVRDVAFMHLYLSTFFLMEQLCRDEAICAGLWELYDYITGLASVEDNSGMVIDTIISASPKRAVLLLHAWPDVVKSLQTLVEALLEKGERSVRNVRKAMEKLCLSTATFIDPAGSGVSCDAKDAEEGEIRGGWVKDADLSEELKHAALFSTLGRLQTALQAWPKAARMSQEEVDALRNEHYEFLQRFHSLVSSTNKPGHVESWEGQRRIAFFVNSMYMQQPGVRRVESMPAFSTLTPYYSEEVILSMDTLCAQTPDGVTTLEYLQTLFPQQWTALLERVKRTMPNVDFTQRTRGVDMLSSMDKQAQLELQLWASYRAQTLARTIRGMMYYEQAVKMLAVVEADDFSQQLYSNVNVMSGNPLFNHSPKDKYVSVLEGELQYSSASCEVARAKYSYVVSCQQHAKLLRSSSEADRAKAKAVELLMEMHPSLKVLISTHLRPGDEVAYVESTREGKNFSVLIRYDEHRKCIVKQYEVELPGPILLGEGKPNNQNHAIIFTRGEAVQAIDMNQDGTLEDALKIRQLLGEFEFEQGGNMGRIVGFREFIFTHDVSSIANFFSLQELSFVTSIQRFLDKPLSIRFHYGHPDLFDKVSAMILGGISKASKGINLSEDIFGGFNFVLRAGKATQAEYIQVGKGRDVGLGQITGFVAKISMGNGMQSRSREVYRIAQQLDIFRLLSFCYSSVGFYLNQVFLTLSIWLFVYAKVYLVFDRRSIDLAAIDPVVATVISTEYIFQLGFMLAIPVLLVMAVESGLARAIRKFIETTLRGSVLFFIFISATNAYYVNKAFLTGEAKYMSTGRGFVIAHDRFLSLFRRYLQSHFVPAFEILLLLIVYWHFGAKQSNFDFISETFAVWLLVVSWLWSPVIFNPNGVEWLDVIKDFDGWLQWITAEDDDPDKSWKAWWIQQNAEMTHLMVRKKVMLAIWRCRFLVLVWGFVTAIKLSREERRQSSPEIRWLLVGVVITVGIIVTMQGVAGIRIRISGASSSTSGRLVGLLVCLALASALLFLPIFGIVAIEQMFYFAGAVGFLLYFIVAEASLLPSAGKGRDIQKVTGGAAAVGNMVWNTYRAVHMTIGLVIMVPILLVAFFPFMTHFQTRMLFNQNFSARFTSAKLFAMERERQAARGWVGGHEGGEQIIFNRDPTGPSVRPTQVAESTNPVARPPPVPRVEVITRRKAS